MSRQLDTERALDLYRQGQERLGTHAKTVTYMAVMSTRPSDIMRDPEKFTRELHTQLADLRGRSRSLAVALYQLLRLIWTGRVLDDGYGTRWSRGDLWDQLYEGAGLEKPQRGGVPAEVDNATAPWAGGDDFDRDTTRELVTTVVVEKIKQAQRRPQRKSADAEALTLESLDELDGLLEEIAVSVQGPAQKLIADGGRETIVTSAQRDRRALRWMRVPSGTACGFCLMVASRGAVYASEKSGGGIKGAEFHPNCQCTVVPIFSNRYEDPDMVKEAKRLWKASKASSLRDFSRFIDTLRKGEET
ncbi:VG15 protein [Streptomyces tsukubensis]|uniref:VG15 protein n=1 Tax=Streptomyces tsukubensis TaxID=83656 RepID=UPI0036AC5EEA